MDKTHELHTRDFLHPSEVQAAKDGVKAERHRPQKLRHRTDKNKTELQAALQPSLPPPEDYGTTSCVEGKWITFCLAKSPW